ncbi:hypothetical protein HK100_001788 [Physocladia obscura]|uniref:RING-type domain-containing protein n=1 Tax=Physocladia obscura TaxID=109957 RepID=A0AAD5TFT6_9FUNG|nr:hypothetical protein HK100_001788 [Physocladia obscura]
MGGSSSDDGNPHQKNPSNQENSICQDPEDDITDAEHDNSTENLLTTVRGINTRLGAITETLENMRETADQLIDNATNSAGERLPDFGDDLHTTILADTHRQSRQTRLSQILQIEGEGEVVDRSEDNARRQHLSMFRRRQHELLVQRILQTESQFQQTRGDQIQIPAVAGPPFGNFPLDNYYSRQGMVPSSNSISSADSGLVDEVGCLCCCCSEHTVALVSNKKYYGFAVRGLLCAWYILVLLFTPCILGSYALVAKCGTNPELVHGIGDSENTLTWFLVYMIVLTAVDLPRECLQAWVKKTLTSVSSDNNGVSVEQPPTQNFTLSGEISSLPFTQNMVTSLPVTFDTAPLQLPAPTANFECLKKRIAKILLLIITPFYIILWILITLWLIAGTVWLSASSTSSSLPSSQQICAKSNPELYTFVFAHVVSCWTIGVAWYTLSRWRAWYLQTLELRQRRTIHIGNSGSVFGDISDLSLTVAAQTRAMARARRRRMREFNGVVHGTPAQLDNFNWNNPHETDIDPILLAIINGASSEFWTPVDPMTLRAPGIGVNQAEWDKLKIYAFEGKNNLESDRKGGKICENSNECDSKGGEISILGSSGTATCGNDACIICLSEFSAGELVRELLCGHAFHDFCISRWMRARSEGGEGKRTCPLCVAEVTLTQ